MLVTGCYTGVEKMSKQVKFALVAALRYEGYNVRRKGCRIEAYAHDELVALIEDRRHGSITISGIGCGAALVSKIVHEII